MLKIKDNVDLKELEKFGFILEGDYYTYIESEPKKNWCNHIINNLLGVSIKSQYEGVLNPYYIHKGEITFSSYSFENSNALKTICKLYDLIQAGLVEKVEE